MGDHGEPDIDLIKHLDDANRARLRSQDDLVAHMGAHAGALN
jgi:hypothetical protein